MLVSSTDFIPSMIGTLVFFVITYFYTLPKMLTNYEMNAVIVSDTLMIIIVFYFVMLVYWCVITLISRLIAQNKKQTQEYLSLLNWIKIGVIL